MGRLRHKKRQHATLKHLCRILLEQTSHNLAAGQRTEQRVIFVNLHFHRARTSRHGPLSGAHQERAFSTSGTAPGAKPKSGS
ncbi:uncharacterized protein LOC142557748 isoform X6 [Dermacentor variabilis]|uniref:uncharacterized protein LOC142557748 isoform X6 n=1 Tax=Dermacentor variabilis TaxID=34621 RepID=UPI003F5BC1CA